MNWYIVCMMHFSQCNHVTHNNVHFISQHSNIVLDNQGKSSLLDFVTLICQPNDSILKT